LQLTATTKSTASNVGLTLGITTPSLFLLFFSLILFFFFYQAEDTASIRIKFREILKP
jgi:hypothetical protein